MYQAKFVAQKLQQKYVDMQFEYIPLSALGDRTHHGEWDKNSVGIFVKELEEALLDRKADIAVHSLKDMPFLLPQGLTLGAFLPRGAAGDVLLSNKDVLLKNLPAGTVLGTSSQRRSHFVKKHYPHLQFSNIRGSVETRIAKMLQGEVDGLILAAAAVERLSISLKKELFSFDILPPAVGQGIIAVECRDDDQEINVFLREINDLQTQFCACAERKAMFLAGAGCRQPFSAHAVLTEKKMRLDVAFIPKDSSLIRDSFACGDVDNVDDCEALAQKAIDDLF